MALQSRNTIVVQIGIRKTKALVDTGSQITLVSQSFFQKSEYANSKLSRPDYDVIKGVSNNTLPILGKLSLPIKMNHKIRWTSVHVVRGLNQSLIIGMDFMEKHNVSIHLGSKTIQIAEANNSLPIVDKHHFARTAQKITIPANHEMLVPVNISRLKCKQTVYLEPTENLNHMNFLAAKTITCIQNQRGVLKICNPTEEEIMLNNNAIVASVECVNTHEIIPFYSPECVQTNAIEHN